MKFSVAWYQTDTHAPSCQTSSRRSIARMRNTPSGRHCGAASASASRRARPRTAALPAAASPNMSGPPIATARGASQVTSTPWNRQPSAVIAVKHLAAIKQHGTRDARQPIAFDDPFARSTAASHALPLPGRLHVASMPGSARQAKDIAGSIGIRQAGLGRLSAS